MGNSCTSGSVEISTAGGDTSNAQKFNNNNNNNNNNNTKEICEPCTQGSEKCTYYVKKALDSQRITTENIHDYSDCLLELPSHHEMMFNFDETVINGPDINDNLDEPDIAGGKILGRREISPVSVSDVGAAVPNAESEDEIDISTRSTSWSYKRKNNFEYSLPSDTYSSIYEDKLDVRDTKKRQVIALSDLHLGGSWSDGMDWKLEKYLDGVIEKAEEEIAAVVLLGDVFEMWLEKFAEVPPSNEERVQSWKGAANVLTTAVTKLVRDCAVKVYFVKGNHDHEITEQDVSAVFGEEVIFVPCTLILRIQIGETEEQRVRFSHGHEWDIFNSYVLHQTSNLLPDRPIGYFIARAVATAGRGTESEVEDLLIGLASSVLSVVPEALEDDLVDVLVEPSQHRKLLSRLFEGAFQVKDIDFLVHAKCKMMDEKWIRLDTLLDYPLMRLLGHLVGRQDVFHMIKASTGDYKKYIKRSDEDVIVLAHTHRWDLRKYKNNRGNQVVYANTGCWTNNADEVNHIRLC